MKGASCWVILLMFALLEAWRLKCLAVANQGKTSFPFFFSEVACENIRFSSLFVAVEKRIFSQAISEGDNNFPEDNLPDCL